MIPILLRHNLIQYCDDSCYLVLYTSFLLVTETMRFMLRKTKTMCVFILKWQVKLLTNLREVQLRCMLSIWIWRWHRQQTWRLDSALQFEKIQIMHATKAPLCQPITDPASGSSFDFDSDPDLDKNEIWKYTLYLYPSSISMSDFPLWSS